MSVNLRDKVDISEIIRKTACIYIYCIFYALEIIYTTYTILVVHIIDMPAHWSNAYVQEISPEYLLTAVPNITLTLHAISNKKYGKLQYVYNIKVRVIKDCMREQPKKGWISFCSCFFFTNNCFASCDQTHRNSFFDWQGLILSCSHNTSLSLPSTSNSLKVNFDELYICMHGPRH